MDIETCFCPDSLDEALFLLNKYYGEIQLCAGGTDLFVMMRKGKQRPRFLLDMSGLNLSYLTERGDSLCIGATTTLSALQQAPLLKGEPYLALKKACRMVGSPQIRNMATLAGNICTGISSADTASALLVLDAQVRLISIRGDRQLPLTEFFLAPRKIAAVPDELIVEVILPKLFSADYHSDFRKVGNRKELFISVFNAAELIQTDTDGFIHNIRLSMGVMAPIPIRLFQTEAFLSGKSLTHQVIEDAVQIMQSEVRPRTSRHGSQEYRMLLASNVLKRFLFNLSLEVGLEKPSC